MEHLYMEEVGFSKARGAMFRLCDRLWFGTLQNCGPLISQGRIRPFTKPLGKKVIITLVLPFL